MHIFNFRNIVIGILLASFLTVLFVKSSVIDADIHNRYINDLFLLKELDAQIDKNLLESRYGISSSYDTLNSDLEQIEQVQKRLQHIPFYVDDVEQMNIRALLREHGRQQREKIISIEQFKSKNAIVNNSLRYFPPAVEQVLAHEKEYGLTVATSRELSALLEDVLVYSFLSIGPSLDHITQQIEQMTTALPENLSPEKKTTLLLIFSHARNLLHLRPEVEGHVKEIVSVSVLETADKLIHKYEANYQTSLQRTNHYRLILYGVSVLSLIYIAFVILKLKTTKKDLFVLNESLEHRVRQRTEELSWSNLELIKSEANNRALLWAIPDTMWRTNSEGIFLDFNLSQSEAGIKPTRDWIGRTLAEVLPHDLAQQAQGLVSKTLSTKQVQRFNFKYENAQRVFHYESRMVICGEDEVLTILRDISEQKNLEDQLQRAQKLESIGQLAAGIAHEINTPTQYVSDNTRFVRDAFGDLQGVLDRFGDLLDSARCGEIKPEVMKAVEEEIDTADIGYLVEEIPNALHQALEGVSRIAKIVQSMKDFAHPGSNEKKETDLNRAIESTVTVARNEWKYVADMETEYDELLPPVPCLIGEFNQVILNMIINASHAITEIIENGGAGKGLIKITTKRQGDWAEIRISDSGEGIPEAIRQKIFDPFFTTKEVGKGTGQGLAISHNVIVEKHRGTIDVESEVGRGTTFIIRLPINVEVR